MRKRLSTYIGRYKISKRLWLVLFSHFLIFSFSCSAGFACGKPITHSQTQASYSELVMQGIDAMTSDSLVQADSLFRMALKLQPSHPSSYLLLRYLGQVKEQQGDNSKALEYYTAGLALKPKDLELKLCRAALHYRMGSDGRALLDYSDVLDIEPENHEALLMRAHIYASMHDARQARRDYETLLRLDPWNRKARVGLILLNDRTGRPREAMEQINATIQVFPADAMLYAIRGGMEQKRKQYEMALADLTHAIELEPQNADYYVSRATLYLDMGKRKLARQDTQMAVRLGADAREMAGLLQ
ncbi:MAG: tetratricopeptide repeat protein [Bacteroidaceae bacterium]|nr:tetratricopeptide repeat protein [Bacteroidaceae bacterium]